MPSLFIRYLPILTWGKTYNKSALTNDMVAALIVTIMLIPQSLAYALLAGTSKPVATSRWVYPHYQRP